MEEKAEEEEEKENGDLSGCPSEAKFTIVWKVN